MKLRVLASSGSGAESSRNLVPIFLTLFLSNDTSLEDREGFLKIVSKQEEEIVEQKSSPDGRKGNRLSIPAIPKLAPFREL